MAEVQYVLAGAVVVVVGVSAAVVIACESRRGSSRNVVRVVGRLQVQLSLDVRSVGRISRGGSRECFDQVERNLGRGCPAERFALCVGCVVSCAPRDCRHEIERDVRLLSRF